MLHMCVLNFTTNLPSLLFEHSHFSQRRNDRAPYLVTEQTIDTQFIASPLLRQRLHERGFI